jgi:predicted nuclease of predicted toxin-antitoxin system
MNILADESVDGMIVRGLRAAGHDVDAIAELDPGVSDDVVLQRAADAGRILVTADKDFGELVYRMRRAHAGVILLRLAGLTSGERSSLVVEVFRTRAAELPGAFVVIDLDSVRVRRPIGS